MFIKQIPMHRRDRLKKSKNIRKTYEVKFFKKTSTASDGQTKKKKKRGT